MKRLPLILAVAAALAWAFIAAPAAKAESPKTAEVTITGEAKCAMCALKESDKCQTVIQSKGLDGKVTTYYLADNDAAKAFHENVCKKAKKVTATGTVSKNGDKTELVVSKIELVK